MAKVSPGTVKNRLKSLQIEYYSSHRLSKMSMLDMMLHGGERVKIQNLQGVISWYNGKR